METTECQGCGSQINQQNLINLKRIQPMSERVIIHRQTCSKGRGWNVLDLSMNKIDWFDYAELLNCEFYVSQTGRKHMINTKERFLHAWIVCEYKKIEPTSTREMVKITYNPYENTTFLRDDNKQSIFKADKLILSPEGVFI